MANLLYTSLQDDVIKYIVNLNKNYEIWIDFKEEVKYIDEYGDVIRQNVQTPIKVSHTPIKPIYRVYKRSKFACVVKVIIPQFTISFPQFHNIKYSFNENSVDLYVNLANFKVEYCDIDKYFDSGIKSYLKRTISSILSQEYIADNKYSLLCSNYSTYVYSRNMYNKKNKTH